MFASNLRRVTFASLVASLVLPALIHAQVPAEQLEAMRYRHIGPVGNRIASVSGVVGDPLTYYVGAASGGLWKTEDGGINWRPVFDEQDVHAVGALAVSVSHPHIVWAGTGEPHIRSNVTLGDGVYKSTDRGETWQNMGLEATGRISRVVIHPTNPDIVYVAALGHAHAPQEERGIYRTTDGGATWDHVLFVGEDTGASSVIMDPNNPEVLFAGMWTVIVNTWGRESGGPNSGIYMSRDGGDSWTKLEGNGLPTLPVGKVDVCMSAADSRRVYALIETGDGVPWHGQETESGELWRSDDGARSWQLVNHSRDLGGRTGYYNNCRAMPDDADEVFFLTAAFSRTLDGGHTYIVHRGDQRPGGDYHDLWIDPENPDRMIVGNDGGTAVTQNRGETWHRTQLPIAQMYHVTADNAIPYNVLGNRQDGPSFRGPSNTLYFGRADGIPRGEWHEVGGGESGFATPDPLDPNIVWSSASGSGARGGIVVIHDERNRQFRNVEVWPESTGGWPAEELRYRFQWTFPLLISPHDNNTVYVTSQHVHRTRNGGQSWEVISPDLTTNDKSRQGISGGLTPDNIGVEYCCVIYAFDESPAQEGVFYAGSNDGRVHVSRDDGATWTDVTGNFPNWPTDGVVRGIDASKWDAGKAYLVVEAHQVGDFATYAYRTEDYGRSWTQITDGVPEHPLGFTRSIQEDPVRPGLVFMGTENRVYVSFDDGDHWQAMINNMPPSPIYGLVVQEHFGDLVVGTYGRGFWIVDDLTPLRQLTDEVMASSAHLFEPRDAYRFNNRTTPQVMPADMTNGENPPTAAFLNYWLSEGTAGSEVTLRITNAAGETVRTMDGTSEAGINRVFWDFDGEPSTPIRMRTTPMYADWVDLGPDRVRIRGGEASLRQPPGAYTVTLEVNGEAYSQPLTVLQDPHAEGSMADIQAQFAMLTEIRNDLDDAAVAINRIEWIRRQLQDLVTILEDQGGAEDLAEGAQGLEGSLIDIEEVLIQLRLTGTGQDGVRYPAKVVSKLGHLRNGVESADFAPTDQQREVHALLRGLLRQAESDLQALIDSELADFNGQLRDRGLNPLISQEQ